MNDLAKILGIYDAKVNLKSINDHTIYNPYMIKSQYTTNKNVPLMVEYYFVYSNTRRD